MTEKNLLAELASYLFSSVKTESGRMPSERELAEQLLAEIDEAHETLIKSSPDGTLPVHPGHWREVEAHVKGATGT